MHSSYPTLTDMFCGAGGSSQGAANAGAEIRMAANHWKLAIETHNTNFPETDHDCADINQVDPRRWPTTDILWASPECTNHSLAKGVKRWNGQMGMFTEFTPDEEAERSRATMWDVPRFAEHHDYRAIIVENVVDARHWRLWDAWLHAMRCLDYEYRVCYLNSMFFGVPQSRDRMYAVFWKKNLPAPELDFRPLAPCPACGTDVSAIQSWKKDRRWGRYQRQYLYRCPRCGEAVDPYYIPAAVAIDWSDAGTRIGDRARPLAESTMRRIQAGLDKYGDQVLVVKLTYSHAGVRPGQPVTEPLMTQTARQEDAIAFPPSAVVVFKEHADANSLSDPLTTIVASGSQHALLRMPWLTLHYNPAQHRMITEPMGVVTATDHHSLVQPPPLLLNYYTRTSAVASVDRPLGTLTTGWGPVLIQPTPFLSCYYGQVTNLGVASAMPTVMSMMKHALIQPEKELKIEDCYFRMLEPPEIGRGMAFAGDYIVLGNKRQQVRQYGNAVTPPVAEWLLKQVVEVLA